MVLQNTNDNQDFSKVSDQKKASSPKNASESENKMIGNNNLKELRKSKMKYMKVTLQTKQNLFFMVQRDGMKIKEAAKILGIKYATAKTIIYHKRQKRKQKGKCGVKMCGFTEMVGNRISRLQIISINGNDVKYCKEYVL